MKTVTATLLVALLATTAQAADYRFSRVLPGLQAPQAPEEEPPAEPLEITLNAAFLPEATVGQAYAFDFNPLASISGDGAPVNPNYTWGTADPLPAGLSLSTGGELSGTPIAEGVKGFTVKATYLTSEGEQAYQVLVNPPPAPVLSSMTPASGTSLAGTQITLTGSGFLEGAQVLVAGVAVATTYINSTTLTFTAPTRPVGNASVQAVNGEGLPSSNTLVLVYESEGVVLTITSDRDNYNLLSELIDLGHNVSVPVDVKVVVNSGVTVQATAVTNAAFETGLLPAGSKVEITNYGTICGKGGQGGAGQAVGGAVGQAGGPGIRVQRAAVTIKNLGNIYGGGGGGGGGGAAYNKNGSSILQVVGGGGGSGQSCHTTPGGIAFSNSGSRTGFSNQSAGYGGSGTRTAAGGQGLYGEMKLSYRYVRGGYGGNGGSFGNAGHSGQAASQTEAGNPRKEYAGGAGGAGGAPVETMNGGTVTYQ